MTEKTIVAYDPGLITGIATGFFSDTEPLTLTGTGAIRYEDIRETYDLMAQYEYDHVVSELFVLRTNNPFAADLTGVRVEGILDAVYEGKVIWRDRTKKSQVSDDVLKAHGLWQTGRDVDWEDGRDANDAIIHMLGYVAFDLRHVPTLRRYFK